MAKKEILPPLVPVNPLRTAGEMNNYTLNLNDLRLFIIDCIKEGKTEIPLGDFLFACRVFVTKKEQ